MLHGLSQYIQPLEENGTIRSAYSFVIRSLEFYRGRWCMFPSIPCWAKSERRLMSSSSSSSYGCRYNASYHVVAAGSFFRGSYNLV
jgi:hypothetical protein